MPEIIPQTETNINNMANAMQKMREHYDEVMDRMDHLETVFSRRDLGGVLGGNDSTNKAERDRFASYLRYGDAVLDLSERKAMIASDDTKGGYLAPAEFSAEILRNVVQFSPVRQVARVATASAGEVLIPKRTGTLTGKWVGETEKRSSAEPSYGQISIPINEMACYTDISLTMLEDAAVDIVSEITFDLAQEFARLEDAFLNGTGVKQPFGIMSDSTIPTVKSGDATKITADGLIDTFYALKPFYRNQSTWMLNSTSVAAVRKLKDQYGQYLWQPSLAPDQPASLLGRPVLEANMPDIATGATPILLGDFKSGYRIYDRVNLAVTRDDLTMRTEGLCRLHARRRLGGGIALSEAFVRVLIGTS